MKGYLIILIAIITTTTTYSQPNCNIKEEYKNIFKIEKKQYKARVYLMKSVNKLDSRSCFADLINNNEQYIDYLLSNFSDFSNHDKWLSMDDSTERQIQFINSLENDSTFNEVMSKLTEKLTNKKSFVQDTISEDELLDIAVKYFEIINIRNDGNYIGKMCAGFNGINDTEEKRIT